MSDQISHEEQLAWPDVDDEAYWTEWMNLDWNGDDVALPDSIQHSTHSCFVPTRSIDHEFPSAHGELPMSHGFDDAIAISTDQFVTSANGIVTELRTGFRPQPDGENDENSQVVTPQTGHRGRKRKHREDRNDREIRCPEAGCDHDGTFPRAFELERHITAKHRSSKPFFCPVVGCFKGRNVTSFPRSDKLTAHIVATHFSSAARANCVAPKCTVEDLPFDLLVAHARVAHEYDGPLRKFSSQSGRTGSHLNALDNARGPDHTQCPDFRCQEGRRIRHAEFAEHVLSKHTADEIFDMKESLGTQGYLLIPTLSGTGDEGVSLMLTCPLCQGKLFHGHKDFEQHIVERHILKQTDEIIAHWRSWRDYLRHGQIRLAEEREDEDPWNSWTVVLRKDRKCPTCGHEILHPYFHEDTHHFQFLRKEEDVIAELYPHRREILRKFPAFWSHPVFNYLKTTSQETRITEERKLVLSSQATLSNPNQY